MRITSTLPRHRHRHAGHSAGEAVGGRKRREPVGWVALGLVIAVVLALFSRSTGAPTPTAPPSPTTAVSAPTSHHTAKLAQGVDLESAAAASGTIRRHHRQVASTPLPPPSMPSSTSSNPTPTTSPMPTTSASSPPHLVESSPTVFAGALSYPEDIATSYPFTTTSGLAAVRASWAGGAALVVSLRCSGAVTTSPARHGVSLSVAGRPGTCNVDVALAAGTETRVAYRVTVETPGPDPSP